MLQVIYFQCFVIGAVIALKRCDTAWREGNGETHTLINPDVEDGDFQAPLPEQR